MGEERMAELTHYLNFQRASCAVTLSVPRDARVGSLVAHPLHVLDDQGPVGEYLLLPVDRQHPSVALPHDALDRISGNRASHAKSFTRDYRLLVHVADEGETVDVETRRMFRGSDLFDHVPPLLLLSLSIWEKGERVPCLRGCDTFVQSTVVRVSAGDVQIGDHVAVHRNVLADLKPLGV